jgi:hypothetical protein
MGAKWAVERRRVMVKGIYIQLGTPSDSRIPLENRPKLAFPKVAGPGPLQRERMFELVV